MSQTIPLCYHHFDFAAMSKDAWDRRHHDAMMARALERPDMVSTTRSREKHSKPCVYYAEITGKVKIGTTTDLVRRMRELYVPKENLLAVERGGHKVESQRHQLFAAYRTRGTELFDHCAILDEHIQKLLDKNPDPWKRARELNEVRVIHDLVPYLSAHPVEGPA